MRPGSLRIVGIDGQKSREVYNFSPESVEQFYSTLERMEERGFTTWLYEMTDKGWTEF
ncbi:hypothetical protein SEA_PAVLO_107 [Microbacterium phage Pavlo]|nr:hypothetical protein SEA_ROMAN_108 [Microbacterium phage Roman]QIG58651.1 hypothetical protein SEA_HUBBS_106 [Microbacterium phage Hubbs]UVG34163.1 hypothetical protein SEA_PAVLO_107 [Microbacterium phage Pavlo]